MGSDPFTEMRTLFESKVAEEFNKKGDNIHTPMLAQVAAVTFSIIPQGNGCLRLLSLCSSWAV